MLFASDPAEIRGAQCQSEGMRGIKIDVESSIHSILESSVNLGEGEFWCDEEKRSMRIIVSQLATHSTCVVAVCGRNPHPLFPGCRKRASRRGLPQR